MDLRTKQRLKRYFSRNNAGLRGSSRHYLRAVSAQPDNDSLIEKLLTQTISSTASSAQSANIRSLRGSIVGSIFGGSNSNIGTSIFSQLLNQQLQGDLMGSNRKRSFADISGSSIATQFVKLLGLGKRNL